MIFRSIRQRGRLTVKWPTCKCDGEFLRFCLLYDWTPSFVRIISWKKQLKNPTWMSIMNKDPFVRDAWIGQRRLSTIAESCVFIGFQPFIQLDIWQLPKVNCESHYCEIRVSRNKSYQKFIIMILFEVWSNSIEK